MKRPTLPAERVAPVLPPTCFQHTPGGSVKYCPACAAARIDHDRALNPVPAAYKHPDPMLIAVASVLAGAAIVVLTASLFLMTGVLTWQ